MRAFKTIFLAAIIACTLFPFKSIAHDSASIPGVKLLTLTNEEFLKLGVKIEAKRLVFFKEMPIELARLPIGREITIPENDLVKGKPEIIAKFSVTTNGINAGDIAPQGEVKKLGIARITPVVMTSYRNQKLMAMYWESRDSASMKFIHANAQPFHNAKSFNSLIPLHTVLKDTNSKRFKEIDVVLWYEATPDLIALLPERFTKPLLKEKTENLTSDGSETEYQPQYGALINTIVYPNPIGNQRATVGFSLSAERTITITLHDIFGRKLAELRTDQNLAPGSYSEDVVLKNIAKGIYLISIQTDRGEQAVQRVIVE